MKNKWMVLWSIMMLMWSGVDAHTQPNVAYKDSQVRFTVISDGAIRLEYAPDGKFIDEKSHVAVVREYPSVDYRINKKGSWIEISTAKMKLRYKKNSGKFTAENLSITSAKGVYPFSWKPGMEQKGNLKGTYRTLDGMDGDLQTRDVSDSRRGDTLKLENGLLATDGWTLIDDSESLLFDNDSDWEWVKERPANGGQDWYFMAYGHDYKAALKDFTLFAGKVPLPPRYAFGYWWSRYWLYSDKEFRSLIDNFHTYRIPLDVLVVDMDWHYTEPGKGGWTGWTWNRDLFPNPQKFLAYLKENDLKVTLNLHPADGFDAYEERYAGLAQSMGVDPQSKQRIPWINSDKKFMRNMFKYVLDPMQEEGVDFWWLDWQQGLFDQKMNKLNNTWWLNYAFFSHMEKNGNTRPLLYHRWGGLGNHRYQIGFSGDAVVSWKSLDYLPYFNSTASNVLYGYWSHDLGGHIGEEIDPEMYTRWLQFGAFSPIMRTHSQKSAGLNKEPWVFDNEYSDIIRRTILQRYEMAPYIYTMARKGYDEGLSLCRPMYYDYPECKEAYEFRNEYMFGDAMLIAPITSPGKDGYASVRIWLPQGEWYELSTGTLFQGGQILERAFAVDEYPVYVKAGAVLPMYTTDVMNLAANNEAVVVTVFPGGESSSFNLYEDNGNDKHYASEYAVTALKASTEGQVQTVVIGQREGSYKDMPESRTFKVKICGAQMPESVTVNGVPAAYEYLGDEFALLVNLSEVPCSNESIVKITYPVEQANMNGLMGAARRVAKSMEGLKYRESYICFKEEFGRMGSLSEAVVYNPDRFNSLVSDFWKTYKDFPEVLNRQGLNEQNKTWFLQSIGWK